MACSELHLCVASSKSWIYHSGDAFPGNSVWPQYKSHNAFTTTLARHWVLSEIVKDECKLIILKRATSRDGAEERNSNQWSLQRHYYAVASIDDILDINFNLKEHTMSLMDRDHIRSYWQRSDTSSHPRQQWLCCCLCRSHIQHPQQNGWGRQEGGRLRVQVDHVGRISVRGHNWKRNIDNIWKGYLHFNQNSGILIRANNSKF